MDESLLARCRELVEARLGWGPADQWVPHDFERLSEAIFESTGQLVSATTLKRVWGRVKYDSSPSAHTLDTLAMFLGYSHWRVFKLEHGARKRRRFVVGIPLGVTAVALLVISLAWRDAPGANDEGDMPSHAAIPGAETATFASRPVADGLPNTVVFEYDVRGVTADSFSIQQSWDTRLRSSIDPAGDTFTSLYYYPGHFQAKLIANDTVIREHPLHIKTDGWLALVEDFPVPEYISAAGVERDGGLRVTDAWLASHDVDVRDGNTWVSHYLVREFGDVDGDNFRFETAIRVGGERGQAPCRKASIIVMAERAPLFLPMSIPGCASDLYAAFSEVEIPGDTNDLSAFGRDMTTWQDLALEIRGRRVAVTIGGEAVLDTVYAAPIGRVVGFRYRFQGDGAIRYLRVLDGEGTAVYAEEFGRG